MREHVCAAVGADVAELPYVAELLDLKPDQTRWRLAVEKVLRGRVDLGRHVALMADHPDLDGRDEDDLGVHHAAPGDARASAARVPAGI